MHLNLKQMNRLCPPAPSVTEWMHGHGRTAEKVQDNFKAIHLGARGARALCLREQQLHGTGEGWRGGHEAATVSCACGRALELPPWTLARDGVHSRRLAGGGEDLSAWLSVHYRSFLCVLPLFFFLT